MSLEQLDSEFTMSLVKRINCRGISKVFSEFNVSVKLAIAMLLDNNMDDDALELAKLFDIKSLMDKEALNLFQFDVVFDPENSKE